MTNVEFRPSAQTKLIKNAFRCETQRGHNDFIIVVPMQWIHSRAQEMNALKSTDDRLLLVAFLLLAQTGTICSQFNFVGPITCIFEVH